MADERGARARTRRAILDAAIRRLADTPNCALSEIADDAGVGRTTLHRYFPERADLIDAVRVESVERMRAATARARLGEGPALEALERLASSYLDEGDLLTYLFFHAEFADEAFWQQLDHEDETLATTIARGQAAGELEDSFRPDWISNVVFSLLYSALSSVREGTLTRGEASRLIGATLRGGVAARPTASPR